MTLSLHFSVIEHEIFLAKKNWDNRILKTELSFLSRKQLVLGITHAVKINTAVSTGSTYCPPPSYVSLLRSWSEILGCKVGPHFVANAYEYIHDQNTRRARESKFIRIYMTSVTLACALYNNIWKGVGSLPYSASTVLCSIIIIQELSVSIFRMCNPQ